MAVARSSRRNKDRDLGQLMRHFADGLASAVDAVEAVNQANRAEFFRNCETVGLSPTDASALGWRPPEVELAQCRLRASVRLTSTRTRETGITLGIAGRVVDSFYQKRFGTEETSYQQLDIEVERVAGLEAVLVVDRTEREEVRTLLLAFVRRNQGARGRNLASWMEEARRFARLGTFRRVVVLRATGGWVCLLPPARSAAHWASVTVGHAGEVRAPAFEGRLVLPIPPYDHHPRFESS